MVFYVWQKCNDMLHAKHFAPYPTVHAMQAHNGFKLTQTINIKNHSTVLANFLSSMLSIQI